MKVLCPFVYWAQNRNDVFLKVDLKDVKEHYVHLEKQRKLEVHLRGIGAQGLNDYAFSLDFYGDVEKPQGFLKLTDNAFHLNLKKLEGSWWPRLISKPQKPAWLKIDFDKWQSEDNCLKDDEVRDIHEDFPDFYGKLQKEELGYKREEFRKVYLTLYNLFMFVGYLYAFSVISIKYVRHGPSFIPSTYSTTGKTMIFLQLVQCFEIFHCLLGYVKGNILMPVLQNFGRLFVLIFMLEYEPRVQKIPVIFYLFLIWSAAEIIRYPYYATQLYKTDNYWITWLRYTAWIILYPLGFICEALIIFQNLIILQGSDKWSITMPNRLNFSFDFLTFLRIYLLFVTFPAIFTLMKHMYKARLKKLNC